MRMEKEKSYPGFQVGTSFLLVIFVILCLVLLGVLSLSGALRDKEYGDRTAEKTRQYYQAVSEAQYMLGKIDAALAQAEESAKSHDAFLEKVAQMTETLEGVSYMEEGGKAVLSYETVITDSQNLSVELEVLDTKESGEHYKIIKWQEVSPSEWEEETTLPVLFGEE